MSGQDAATAEEQRHMLWKRELQLSEGIASSIYKALSVLPELQEFHVLVMDLTPYDEAAGVRRYYVALKDKHLSETARTGIQPDASARNPYR